MSIPCAYVMRKAGLLHVPCAHAARLAGLLHVPCAHAARLAGLQGSVAPKGSGPGKKLSKTNNDVIKLVVPFFLWTALLLGVYLGSWSNVRVCVCACVCVRTCV